SSILVIPAAATRSRRATGRVRPAVAVPVIPLSSRSRQEEEESPGAGCRTASGRGTSPGAVTADEIPRVGLRPRRRHCGDLARPCLERRAIEGHNTFAEIAATLTLQRPMMAKGTLLPAFHDLFVQVPDRQLRHCADPRFPAYCWH